MRVRRKIPIFIEDDLGVEPLPVAPAAKRPVNKGPSQGYGSGEKMEWRDQYWSQLVAFVPKKHRAGVELFVIESLDGYEIEKLQKLGFPQSAMHVCNANPAVVATLKRRFPEINTYGVTAERALRRIRREGRRITIASLDFCSCLSPSVMDTVRALRGVLGDRAAVGVNIARGREMRGYNIGKFDPLPFLKKKNFTPRGQKMWKSMKPTDRQRSYFLYLALCVGAPSEEPVLLLDGEEWVVNCRGDQGLRGADGKLIRRSAIRAMDIYPGMGRMTMLWTVMYSIRAIEGFEDLDISTSQYAPPSGAQSRAQSGRPSLQATGFRC